MPACSLPTAPPLLTGTASTLIGTLSYHLHLMIYTLFGFVFLLYASLNFRSASVIIQTITPLLR